VQQPRLQHKGKIRVFEYLDESLEPHEVPFSAMPTHPDIFSFCSHPVVWDFPHIFPSSRPPLARWSPPASVNTVVTGIAPTFSAVENFQRVTASRSSNPTWRIQGSLLRKCLQINMKSLSVGPGVVRGPTSNSRLTVNLALVRAISKLSFALGTVGILNHLIALCCELLCCLHAVFRFQIPFRPIADIGYEKLFMKPISAFLGQVILGDCIEVMATIPAASVDLVVTDPPYLVNYRPRDGRRCGGDDNDAWLEPSFREMYRVLKPNTFLATFYGWPWIDRFMVAWRKAGFRPVSHLTWPKSYSSYSGYTEGQHEVGYLLAKGHPPKPAKPISDVLPWEYTGNELHPNQKPVCAITPLVEAFSRAGGIVADPFSGSGTTGEASKLLGRRFIVIEKEQRHWRTARERIGQGVFR